MANQIIVTQSGNVQVSIEPTPNVQVQISRAAIGTVSNVPTANFANYAGNVTVSAQPNITSLGTLTGLTVSGNSTVNNLTVTGNLVAGNLVANSANYANFAGVANTANTVAGANVTGVVANATFATSAGTANSATVANTANSVALANVSGAGNIASINLDGNVANLLTGLGTFVAIPTVSANANYANFANIANTANSVAVANVSGIGNIATVNLDGNASNILFGNGIFSAIPAVSNVANANYANFAGTAFSVSGSNVSGEVANAAYANAANTANLATYATTANSVAGANVSGEVANAAYANAANTANLATFATTANAVAGANVSGAVAYATVANSVSVGNVSGIGNISTINIDGNLGNVLYGNGVFAAVVAPTSVANANYANFAGTAFSVAGSNVSGEVANANFASYANIASSANSVALANVSGIGNIANINLDGSSSNVLFGNGVFAPESTSIANANYANFAGTAFNVSGSNVSGEVANAAYANIAGVANSVAGANVSGTVANANYSAFANVAASANSVAVANVSGIGNIATVNLDGSSSNVLFGNGVFAPESTSIANANYANFAGEALVLANGTSNVSIPSANGNIVFSAGGNSDVVKITTTGIINSIPTSTSLNSYVLNSYDTGADAKRIASFKYRGNIATPLSVQPGDTTMRFITLGHNGAALQTSSSASIRGVVDASYTANGANIPIGWSIQVNDTNGGTNNQGKTHNFYANGNVNFANSVVVTDSLSVTGNVTSANANLGNLATANFITGTLTTNSQPNITSLGNLLSLTVSNAVGNTRSSIVTVTPEGNLVGLGTSNAIVTITDFGSQSSNANPLNFTFIKARGNSTTPTTAFNNDQVFRLTAQAYNGNTYATVGRINYQATTASSLPNSNVVWSGGTLNINTGNPNGNTVSTTATNSQNILIFDQAGRVTITPGTYGATSAMVINSFGANSDGSGGGWIIQNRSRGNRDTAAAVADTDVLGGMVFNANNGSGSSNSSSILSVVNTTYGAVTAGAVVPNDIILRTSTNAASFTTTFRGNGSVEFPGNVTATGNVTAYGNLTVGNGSGTITTNRITLNNGTLPGLLQVTGDKTSASGINITDGQFVVISNNSTLSPFFFNIADSNTTIGSQINYRTRGTQASPTAVTASDQIVNRTYNVYGDAGNTFINVGSETVRVVSNDGAGNIGANYAVSFGLGTTGLANSSISYTVANTTFNGNLTVGVTGTIQQLAPNSIAVTATATNNAAYNLTTLYGETSNIVDVASRSVIRSRGNVSTPATVVVSDFGSRDRVYFYNGTTNALGFTSSVTLSNLNSNSNAYSTGTNYNMGTGNPNGDQGNANASSGLNLLSLRDTGQLLLIPGANSTAGSMLNIINYGLSTSLSTAQGITMSKARGNRDANLSVQANDQIGRLVFQAHNGTSFVTNRLPIIRATVDSSYTANTANIPAGFQMLVNDDTTTYTHNFYANGNIAFSGRVSAGNLSVGNIICGDINAIGSVIEAGNSVRIGLDNNTTQGILQTTYNNANIQTGSWTSWRQRGTKASPLGVQAGDEISKFSSVVYADSGNTYVDAVTQLATVVSNDGAGNVVSGFRTRAFGGANSFVSMQAGQIQFMDSSAFTANATIYANGYIDTVSTVSAANVAVTSNGFVKLASYTEAALSAITGQIGWMAAVSDSASGGNPNGMIAFWDTTNNRWSYIHDNSAV